MCRWYLGLQKRYVDSTWGFKKDVQTVFGTSKKMHGQYFGLKKIFHGAAGLCCPTCPGDCVCICLQQCMLLYVSLTVSYLTQLSNLCLRWSLCATVYVFLQLCMSFSVTVATFKRSCQACVCICSCVVLCFNVFDNAEIQLLKLCLCMSVHICMDLSIKTHSYVMFPIAETTHRAQLLWLFKMPYSY